MHKRFFWLTPLLLLAACSPIEDSAAGASGAAASATSTAQASAEAAPPKSAAQPVQAVPALRGALRVERQAAATVDATRTSDVAAKAGGVLLGYDVAEGERVAEGGVVARLDSADARQQIENAQEQLQQAEINLRNARAQTAENLPTLRAAVEAARSGVASAEANVKATKTGVESSRAAVTSAQAGVTSAQTSLATAQKDLSNAQTLYGVGAVSAQEVQARRDAVTQARTGLEQAQGQLKQAQSGVAQSQSQAEQAQAQVTQARTQLTQAQADLERSTGGTASNTDLLQSQVETARQSLAQAQERAGRAEVTAPFAGTVSRHLVQPGEFAGQGSPVFRLVDTGSIRAKFRLPPEDAAQLTPGTRFNLGYGGKNYVATVLDGDRLTGDDRLVQVEARIEGGGEIPLGAAAAARYRVQLAEGFLVPSRAIQVSGSESAVFVVDGATARRQPVQVLAESDGQVAVSGLKDGDQVVYPLPAGLRGGAQIEVRAAESSAASTSSAAVTP